MEMTSKIFARKHRHKWVIERRLNDDVHMIWSLRRCKCGVVELLHAGGTGDKKWHEFDGSFKFGWERKWFEEAEVI